MRKKVINLFGDKIVPNTGVKYSELLEQFMSPFQNDFIETEYIEDIIEFSITAWNIANINIIMPNVEMEKAMNSIQQNGEDISLLKKMIAHKKKKYKAFTNFIVDFEIEEGEAGKDPILSVVTQEEEAYLANIENEVHECDVHSQDNYEENYINRIAIIIKPLQPFTDWFNVLYPNDNFEFNQVNTYLVSDDIDDVDMWLKKKFDKFFTMELGEWHDNKKEWPQRRSYKMFKQWFQIEVSELIYDLEKRPVLKIE